MVRAQLNSKKAAINVQWLRRDALRQNFDADANRGAASPYPVGRIYGFISHIERRLWLDGCGGCILKNATLPSFFYLNPEEKNPIIMPVLFYLFLFDFFWTKMQVT